MTFFETLNELIAAGRPVVAVTVVDAVGSVPNDRGSKMIVTEDGLHSGTVGGGRVEKKAIDEALRMLGEATESTHFVNWQLNRDVGMTCGGAVKLYFEAFNVASWNVVVFGAGHIAQALVPLLCTLDCRVQCLDTRAEWLETIPASARLTKTLSTNLAGEVAFLPDDAFVVLMTMGHATDSPILVEILRTRRFPFLGVIGSRAKANILKNDIASAGLPPESQEAFLCPVGLPIGSNHPAEIAISIAAQLLEKRDSARESKMRS
ncbi:MAG: xanthine dehydrogenase accessory protein XdhC [Acidobacteria bacterium]|nr:xanthine dehydrogenase accessory protein XdhC [Acidobacteriota bacterium]